MSHYMRVRSWAYTILCVALMVLQFGPLDMWQRTVSLAAFVGAATVLSLPGRGDRQ